MNEKMLNGLKAQKAEKMTLLQAIAERAATGTVNAEDTKNYPALKKEIASLEAMIIDAQNQIDAADRNETAKPVGNKKANFENFLRNGDTRGLESANSRQINNAAEPFDRSKATVLVPAEVEKEIRFELRETSLLRRIANVRSINAREHQIPVEGTDVAAKWIDEGGDFTVSDTTVSSKTLTPYKNGALVQVTNELIEDSIIEVEPYVKKKIVIGLNKNFEDAALLNTNTALKRPLGLISQATLGATTASGVSEITTEDIVALYFSVPQEYRKKGTWLIASTALPKLINLTDENGNRIYYPSFVPNVPDTLMGKPVEEVELLNAEFAKLDGFPILFGDFSQLEIGERKGIAITRLNELYAASGKVGFIAEERIDSVLVFGNAIKKLKIGPKADPDPEI